MNRQVEIQRKREEEASKRLEEKMIASKKADEWRKGDETKPDSRPQQASTQAWRASMNAFHLTTLIIIFNFKIN